MRLPINHLLLAFAIALCAVLSSAAQRLAFARTFDNQGALVDAGSEFKFQPPHLILAVKFTGRTELPLDTLFVIVKDINGVAGRFYMKTSKHNRINANALIRIKNDGIYRIYIYNPKRRVRPIAHGTVYLTSTNYPTKKALLERQRQILVDRGIIKDKKEGDDPFASADGDEKPRESSVEDEFDDLEFAFESDLEDGEDLDDELEFGEDDFDFDIEKDIAPEDVSGEFESFDDLDDDFDFEIDDF